MQDVTLNKATKRERDLEEPSQPQDVRDGEKKDRSYLLILGGALFVVACVIAVVLIITQSSKGHGAGTDEKVNGAPTAAPSLPEWCERGDPCWPTIDEIMELRAQLNPEMERKIEWEGVEKVDGVWTSTEPKPMPAPFLTPEMQPLYGLGLSQMEPLYYSNETITDCFTETFNTCMAEAIAENGADPAHWFPWLQDNPESCQDSRDICRASSRDAAMFDWNPAFVVFALTPDHVVASVEFAREHNLCISVAGTAHDFLNRHSCGQDGLFVRTSLLKEIDWDLDNQRGFSNAPDGNVKLGAGIVFTEAFHTFDEHDRFVSSGWCPTVGIAGWSMGGGHGWAANYAGMGVDNILEVDIVLANGTFLTANENQHSDLFWALRGGGGSTWGIVTAYTIRAHSVPEGGLTKINLFTDAHNQLLGGNQINGDFCGDGLDRYHRVMQAYEKFSLTLDYKWSTQGWLFTTPAPEGVPACNATWGLSLHGWYIGPLDEDSKKLVEDFLEEVDEATDNYDFEIMQNNWDSAKHDQSGMFAGYDFNVLDSEGYGNDQDYAHAGMVPSNLLTRENYENGELSDLLKELGQECSTTGDNCVILQLYQDITGNIGAAERQTSDVAISSTFRNALVHNVVGLATGMGQDLMDRFYALSPYVYQNEAAYFMHDPREQIYGENYERLVEIKQKYDPDNLLGCHHCIGDPLLEAY